MPAQAEFRAGRLRKRRNAVQHDARPDPVRPRSRPGDQRGGIGDAALAGKAGGRGREPLDLRARHGAAPVLGLGQVRDEIRRLDDGGAGREPGRGCRRLGRTEPEATHAAVDRAGRGTGAPRRDSNSNLSGWWTKSSSCACLLEFPRSCTPSAARCVGAAAAQRNRLLDAVLKGASAPAGRAAATMPCLGVRLDDRHDAAAGGDVANPREVVPECRRVDDGAQGGGQNAPSP
jgi:hypothetical protein